MKCLVDVRGQRYIGRLCGDHRKEAERPIPNGYNLGLQDSISECTNKPSFQAVSALWHAWYKERVPSKVDSECTSPVDVKIFRPFLRAIIYVELPGDRVEYFKGLNMHQCCQKAATWWPTNLLHDLSPCMAHSWVSTSLQNFGESFKDLVDLACFHIIKGGGA